MGYLPSTLWIILGVIFAGAVQDMLVLWISAKRRGRSLGQMATDEMGKFGGMILSIFLVVMTAIAMAFLALVAIKAMAASPWAVFSIGMTIPIALIMGCYQRFLRPGRVIETTLLGFVLLVLDIVAGGWIASIPAVAAVFHTGRQAARHRPGDLLVRRRRAAALAARHPARLPVHADEDRQRSCCSSSASSSPTRPSRCRV